MFNHGLNSITYSVAKFANIADGLPSDHPTASGRVLRPDGEHKSRFAVRGLLDLERRVANRELGKDILQDAFTNVIESSRSSTGRRGRGCYVLSRAPQRGHLV